MSDKSRIEWTDATWNPVTGCSKVSQGCKNCYAERDWARLSAPRAAPNIYTGRNFTDVRCHPEKLYQPLHWRKPRRIFVNSMSDLFHDDVPDEFILDVFRTMQLTNQHIYQVLTKRPQRMYDFMHRLGQEDGVLFLDHLMGGMMPHLDHIWLGVSVENQATADERIPLLLQTPAAVRWISAEPLLGEINLRSLHLGDLYWLNALTGTTHIMHDGGMPIPPPYASLGWVVIGGESGPQEKARPFDIDAARWIIRQCRAAGVPVFFKQTGRHPYSRLNKWSIRGGGIVVDILADWTFRDQLHDKKGGDLLEWPKDLRVQEYPA